ncbi:hypothetical protein HYX19_04185, partial [Candidatus Woesearchaeota archaeon]|nr:hypothetical protein [Candidatus Woesearchaeota archaeon]
MEFKKIFQPYTSLFKGEEKKEEAKEHPQAEIKKETQIKPLKQLKAEAKPIESKPQPKVENTFKNDDDGFKINSVLYELITFVFLIKIFFMVKKDLKLLIRSRSSALIVIFGPLLTIFL